MPGAAGLKGLVRLFAICDLQRAHIMTDVCSHLKQMPAKQTSLLQVNLVDQLLTQAMLCLVSILRQDGLAWNFLLACRSLVSGRVRESREDFS